MEGTALGGWVFWREGGVEREEMVPAVPASARRSLIQTTQKGPTTM
jgi:hypothetical protein